MLIQGGVPVYKSPINACPSRPEQAPATETVRNVYVPYQTLTFEHGKSPPGAERALAAEFPTLKSVNYRSGTPTPKRAPVRCILDKFGRTE